MILFWKLTCSWRVIFCAIANFVNSENQSYFSLKIFMDYECSKNVLIAFLRSSLCCFPSNYSCVHQPWTDSHWTFWYPRRQKHILLNQANVRIQRMHIIRMKWNTITLTSTVFNLGSRTSQKSKLMEWSGWRTTRSLKFRWDRCRSRALSKSDELWQWHSVQIVRTGKFRWDQAKIWWELMWSARDPTRSDKIRRYQVDLMRSDHTWCNPARSRGR